MNNLLVNYGGQSKYGADIPLATFGITMKVCQLAFGIALGIATSVQPIYGFNYGCGQYVRVKKTFGITMFTSVAVMLLALAAFQIFPQNIIALFGQESDLYASLEEKQSNSASPWPKSLVPPKITTRSASGCIPSTRIRKSISQLAHAEGMAFLAIRVPLIP